MPRARMRRFSGFFWRPEGCYSYRSGAHAARCHPRTTSGERMSEQRRYVRIAGWGKYLPERVMPNAELEQLVATSDEWIRARTGIGERRVATIDESTSSLAVNAARAALDRAQVRPEDVNLIIVATCTPDYAHMPSTASLVQDAV